MEWVIPAVVLLLLIWGAVVHRRLVAMRDLATQGWSEIDALFHQRQDLVRRLLDQLEGHLPAGARPVRALTDARKAAANAQSPASIGRAESVLGAAIARVLALAEADAALRSDAGLRRLRADFAELDGRIDERAQFFNEAVDDFNTERAGFPGGFLTYVVNLPPIERLAFPEAAAPEPGQAIQRP